MIQGSQNQNMSSGMSSGGTISPPLLSNTPSPPMGPPGTGPPSPPKQFRLKADTDRVDHVNSPFLYSLSLTLYSTHFIFLRTNPFISLLSFSRNIVGFAILMQNKNVVVILRMDSTCFTHSSLS